MDRRNRKLLRARNSARLLFEVAALLLLAGCDGCSTEDTGGETAPPTVNCGGDSVPTDGAPMGMVSLGEAEAYSVSMGGTFAAGDQDGDGCTDFAFGGSGGEDYGYTGVVSLLPAPVHGEFDIYADKWATLIGAPDDWAYAIASGDVNGDELADWIVGGFGIRDDLGGVYVAYGPVTESMELANEADALLIGQDCMLGTEVHKAADLDADGFAELLIGAPGLVLDETPTSAVYVVPGPVSGTSWLADTETFITTGDVMAQLGNATSAGGDVDGDGLTDIVVGSGYYEPHGGAVWAFFSPLEGEVHIDNADATLTGEGGKAGSAVSSGGDVDGDGYGDVLVGAYAYSDHGGRAYLVLGPFEGTQSLGDADGIVEADGLSAEVGEGVSLEQDMDADGQADIVISAPGTTGSPNKGAVFVFYEPFEGLVDGNRAADAVLYSETDENSPGTGRRLAPAGDLNGDGFDDLYIAGQVEYLIFGGER